VSATPDSFCTCSHVSFFRVPSALIQWVTQPSSPQFFPCLETFISLPLLPRPLFTPPLGSRPSTNLMVCSTFFCQSSVLYPAICAWSDSFDRCYFPTSYPFLARFSFFFAFSVPKTISTRLVVVDYFPRVFNPLLLLIDLWLRFSVPICYGRV